MKKQIKKLTLAKETLRNLDEKDVLFVLGGISGSACGNPTCKQDCARPTSTFAEDRPGEWAAPRPPTR